MSMVEDDGIQIDVETSKRYADLYVTALQGDWSKAEEVFNEHPGDVRAELSDVGDTVLHVAAKAGKNDFLKKLVSKYMEEDDLKKTNKVQHTAFYIAAMSGDTELAESMLEKNEDLAMICIGEGMLPVVVAASLGHEKMVKYLYEATKDKLTEENRIELLVTLIGNDLYDVALKMVEAFPKLAVSRVKGDQKENRETEEIGETALHALARKPLTFYDFNMSKQGIWSQYRYFLSGTDKMQSKRMHPKARKLVELLWDEVVEQLDYYKISELIEKPRGLIFDAAEEGNIDFLSIITSKRPDLLFKVNAENYSIFHTAVSCRHENIFKLIYKIPSIKNFIVSLEVGKEKNNILHLAAKLPDQNGLKIVSGAALQMQRELWWFKEVSKLMPPFYAEVKNGEGKTAHSLFTESHKDLMKDAKEWMKKTAESCMLVATLIATVGFAAIITVPGGLNNDTGVPNFITKNDFSYFTLLDIMAVVSSTCSIGIFLSIITARYAEGDFFLFLPRRLCFGLLTLVVALEGMMLVFAATLSILFFKESRVLALLGDALVLIPIMLFLWQLLHLFRQLST